MHCARDARAALRLPRTNGVDRAQVSVQGLPAGGRTPLSRGLYLALGGLETERLKDRDTLPLVVLLSDGRANVSLNAGNAGASSGGASPSAIAGEEANGIATVFQEKHITSVVVDTELGFIKLGLAQPIAEAMGARYIKLDDLRADRLAEAIRQQLPDGEAPEVTSDEVQTMVRRLGLT